MFGSLSSQFSNVSGQQNVNQTNQTDSDSENPAFDGLRPLVPLPESQRVEPPVPADAVPVSELPSDAFVRENDTDRSALSITNITEILEILPANSTKIIKFVDEDLKNSTGVGLLPEGLLDQVTNEAKSGEVTNASERLVNLIPESELAKINTTVSEQVAEEEKADEAEEVPVPDNATATQTTPSTPSEDEDEDGETSGFLNLTKPEESDTTASDIDEDESPRLNLSEIKTLSTPSSEPEENETASTDNESTSPIATESDDDEDKTPRLNLTQSNTPPVPQSEDEEQSEDETTSSGSSSDTKSSSTQDEDEDEKIPELDNLLNNTGLGDLLNKTGHQNDTDKED